MNCISFNTITLGFEDDLDCGICGVPSLSIIDCAPFLSITFGVVVYTCGYSNSISMLHSCTMLAKVLPVIMVCSPSRHTQRPLTMGTYVGVCNRDWNIFDMRILTDYSETKVSLKSTVKSNTQDAKVRIQRSRVKIRVYADED